MRRFLCAMLLAFGFLAGPAAAAPQLIEIRTPSEHVDPADVAFNGAGHPRELRAKVLLPHDYDPGRSYRVLYLLHGVGDAYHTWSRADRGDVARIAADLDAIVVMPEAARGFYANHFNEGRRGKPGWERFYLDELIPLVEDRFPVRVGRRNHAVAGLSMGGFGTMLLAARRPDYFGSAASFSGALNIQRPEFEKSVSAVAGVDYERVFGPRDGFYATGHNPTELAANLAHSRLYVTVGDGSPEPEHASEANPGAAAVEAGLRPQSEDFVAAVDAAGAAVTYVPRAGQHDWPYWREHLAAAIRWGLFDAAPSAPSEWRYATVSQTGRMWDFRYAFEQPPGEVVTFTAGRGKVSATGSGRVTLTAAGGGCSATFTLPVQDAALPGGCEVAPPARIELNARPSSVRRGRRVTIRFRAFARLPEGRVPVARAVVRFAGLRRRTDGDGIARFRVRLTGRPGLRRASASKTGLLAGRVHVRVR